MLKHNHVHLLASSQGLILESSTPLSLDRSGIGPKLPAITPKAQQEQMQQVLDYVASRGIRGAWFESATMLRAPGNVPLRDVTDDAGISCGGGGLGRDAYSQVQIEKFSQPEDRARQMLSDMSKNKSEKPFNFSPYGIYLDDNGNLITKSKFVALAFCEEMQNALPLFRENFLKVQKANLGKYGNISEDWMPEILRRCEESKIPLSECDQLLSVDFTPHEP